MKRQVQSPRLPLNPDLEKAVLCGIIHGEVALEKVTLEELSKDGQYVYTALKEFDRTRPITPKGIYLHATEVLGADGQDFRTYLKAVTAAHVPQVESVLDALSRKTIINDLVNEASAQVSGGQYSLLALKGLLERHTSERSTLVSLSRDMEHVEPPTGLQLPGLDSFNEHVGGLFGMMVLCGGPGVGKSTLALTMACLTSALHRPVLYYDFEQGKSVIRWHIHQGLQGHARKIKDATRRLYIRSNVGLLERDLEMVNEPALVIVDSIQKVAKGLTFRRESLENWVHKLEGLKHEGHYVLAVSEKNRAHYDEPSMNGAKETGEIEYAADTMLDVMLPNPEDSTRVDVHVVKNRHYPFKGHLTTLNRVNGFWFTDPYKQSRKVD